MLADRGPRSGRVIFFRVFILSFLFLGVRPWDRWFNRGASVDKQQELRTVVVDGGLEDPGRQRAGALSDRVSSRAWIKNPFRRKAESPKEESESSKGVCSSSEPSVKPPSLFKQQLLLGLMASFPALLQVASTWIAFGVDSWRQEKYLRELQKPGSVGDPNCVIMLADCVEEKNAPPPPLPVFSSGAASGLYPSPSLLPQSNSTLGWGYAGDGY